MQKIVLIHPSGGCGNYILLVLCKISFGKNVAYHDVGTHGKGLVKDYRHLNKKNLDATPGILVVRNQYADAIEVLKSFETKVDPIQVVIDDYNELVILNWFMKHDDTTIKNWTSFQLERWTAPYALEKAVCHWTNKMFNPKFEDIKLIDEIKNTFSFSSLYKTYEISKKEFNKFGIDYSKQQHCDFLTSQQSILDVWERIKKHSISNPMALKTFYERGIALSLNQQKLNLDETTVFQKFNL